MGTFSEIVVDGWDWIMSISYRFRMLLAFTVALALGVGGTALYFGIRNRSEPTPSLYVNSNGADVLRHPERHIAALVRFRGEVMGSKEVGDGALVTLRVDGVPVAAHVYDRSWAPIVRSPLQIEGRVRGRLGDPIEACGLPVPAPLRRHSTLIDVSEAMGPHRSRAPGETTGAARRSGGPCG